MIHMISLQNVFQRWTLAARGKVTRRFTADDRPPEPCFHTVSGGVDADVKHKRTTSYQFADKDTTALMNQY